MAFLGNNGIVCRSVIGRGSLANKMASQRQVCTKMLPLARRTQWTLGLNNPSKISCFRDSVSVGGYQRLTFTHSDSITTSLRAYSTKTPKKTELQYVHHHDPQTAENAGWVTTLGYLNLQKLYSLRFCSIIKNVM